MIKRLQRKFVAIAMGSLLLILLLLLGAVNGVNLYQLNARANHLLHLLADNEGKFPAQEPGKRPQGGRGGIMLSPETPFEVRYFTVKATADGTVRQIDTGHVAAISSSQAQQYAETALKAGDASGYMGHYKYLAQSRDYGTFIVFIDRHAELQNALFLLLLSVAVAAAILVVMFVLMALLSRRALRPVAKSLEKQKSFITNASHEIKTPLAIISANTEVIELTQGASEWTDSTKKQVQRLGDLVRDMLLLSRMEEDRVKRVFVDFSLSDAVAETIRTFQPLAQARGLEMRVSLQDGLTLRGEEAGIRQLVSILMDNAIRYAREQSGIEVRLSAQGRYAVLEVANPCDPFPEDLNALFDRFYRAEPSRSRDTGGTGIGLSVARAVAEAHRGRIAAQRVGEDIIRFRVQLPLN